jgi:hypothetical protein
VFLLFFAALFIYWKNGSVDIKSFKQKTPQQLNGALTSEDRKNFIVTISKEDIGKPASASSDPSFPSNMVYLSCRLKVSNNSNDTLKYLNKSCAWYDILKTDNVKLRIWKNSCTNDITKVELVAPHRYTWFNLTLVYNKNKVSANSPFKLGIGIFKFVNKQQLLTFDVSKKLAETDTTNLIWSNTVVIPR